MPFVATVGTLVGGSTYVGTIGVPPLPVIPARPKIAGVDVAIVGDLVLLTNTVFPFDVITPPISTGSVVLFVNGFAVAVQGSVVGPSFVQVPSQVIVSA